MRSLPTLLACCLLSSTVLEGKPVSPWERSVVHIDVKRIVYSLQQPWARSLNSHRKNGVVVDGRRILTSANHFQDHTLVRVQKGGRGEWTLARPTWIDHHANLALLTVDEDAFWEGLEAAPLARPTPDSGPARLIRWNDGRLEIRDLSINHMRLGKGQLTHIDLLHLELDSDIQGIGWSEILAVEEEVIGLASGKSNDKIFATPSSRILSILEARKEGRYTGLGFFNFYWQPSLNPATLARLGLEGPLRGVVVTRIPELQGDDNILQPRDILLEADGFAIDSRGDYRDPDLGPTMFEYLATRDNFAGNRIPMKVWRDGKAMELEYTLPKADYDRQLVPAPRYDGAPEFSMHGGLLFQPMIRPHLEGRGGSSVRHFRYRNMVPSAERPGLVVLFGVLPDPYNIGYSSPGHQVVDTVNSRIIGGLRDLEEAFARPRGDYHVIRFFEGEQIDEIVLDAAGLEEATRRIRIRYGLPRTSFILE